MNPAKVDRARLAHLEDLPNIGPACARDLRRLGIHTPADLVGQDAYALYDRLSLLTGTRQDPCVLDVFLSVVRFMAGEPARPWWAYTAERKRALAEDRPPPRKT
ncbi:MAG: mitomycin resistance protein [Thiobacillus sp.]|nr:mitomycin resistance protein [Thiobacillus sp.]